MGIEQFLNNLKTTFNYTPVQYDFYKLFKEDIHTYKPSEEATKNRKVDELILTNGNKLKEIGIKTLLIDFNSILYRSVEEVKHLLIMKKTDNMLPQLEKMYDIIFEHTIKKILLEEIIPYFGGDQLTTVGIFLDGIPSRAKMLEQKRRKYMSVFEEMVDNFFKTAESTVSTVSTESTESTESTVSTENPEDQIKFNRNVISAGTHFMDKLFEYLKANLQGDKFVISPHTEPGEGEHKIREYIRAHPGATDICIYSPDGDVMVTSLLHDNLYVFRSTSIFDTDIKHYPEYYGKNVKYTNSLYDIGQIKQNIIKDISNIILRAGANTYEKREASKFLKTITSTSNVNRIIDDVAFIIVLSGNDFIAKQVLYNATKLKIIIINYRQFLFNSFKNEQPIPFIIQHTKDYSINKTNFAKFISHLANFESKQQLQRKWYFDNNSKIKKLLKLSEEYISLLPDNDKLKLEIEQFKNGYKPNEIEFCDFLRELINKYSESKLNADQKKQRIKLNSYFEHFKLKDLRCEYSELLPFSHVEKNWDDVLKEYSDFQLFKTNYYKMNFNGKFDQSLLNSVKTKYIEGIIWTFEYYFNFMQENKSWIYPYNIAPFLSDLVDHPNYLTNAHTWSQAESVVKSTKDIFGGDRFKQFIYTHPIHHYFRNISNNSMINVITELRVKPQTLIMLHIVLLKHLRPNITSDLYGNYRQLVKDVDVGTYNQENGLMQTLILLNNIYNNDQYYVNTDDNFTFLLDRATLLTKQSNDIFPEILLPTSINPGSITQFVNCLNSSYFGKCHFVFDDINDAELFRLLSEPNVQLTAPTPAVDRVPLVKTHQQPHLTDRVPPVKTRQQPYLTDRVPPVKTHQQPHLTDRVPPVKTRQQQPSSYSGQSSLPMAVPYIEQCLAEIEHNVFAIPNNSHLISIPPRNFLGILCPSGMYWILYPGSIDGPYYIQDVYNGQNIIPHGSLRISDNSVIIQNENVFYLKDISGIFYQIDQNGMSGPFQLPNPSTSSYSPYYASGNLSGGKSNSKSNDHYYYKYLKYGAKYHNLLDKLSS